MRWQLDKKTIAYAAFIAVLVLAVRLYFYTGPIFANSQDEGIYLNIMSQAVINNNFPSFSVYRGANFSNLSFFAFNPAWIPQFYSVLVYPPIFFMKIFGFSANYAIGYVILLSVIEGVFLFLTIKEVHSSRAGLIGGILFAFIPIDVLFSTHVQPLVPMASMLTIATYFFIKGRKAFGDARRKDNCINPTCRNFLFSGFFAGLAYLCNPTALAFIAFMFLYFLAMLLRNKEYAPAKFFAVLLIGFIIAYSIVGVYYLIESGNYLLYPMLDHSSFLYAASTQPVHNYTYGSLVFTSVIGQPFYYIPILLDHRTPDYAFPIGYFSIYTYLMVFSSALLLIYAKKLRSNALLFTSMFAFYLIFISFFVTNVSFSGGIIHFILIDNYSYIAMVLVLPMIALISIGFDYLLQSKEVLLKAMTAILLISAVFVSIGDISRAVSFYNASMSSLYSFISFVEQHPTSTFYAQNLFTQEADILTSFKYDIISIGCSNNTLDVILHPGSYVAAGGTINIEMSQSIMGDFSSCVAGSINKNATIAAIYSDPFSGGELIIYKIAG